MKSLALLFITFLLNLSLKGQEIALEEQFMFYEHADWTFNPKNPNYPTFKLTEGTFILFDYTSNNAGDPGNFSTATSKLLVKIESTATSFHYSSEELAQNTAMYIQLCRCPDSFITWVDHGFIKGGKLEDGNWKIEADVNFKGTRTGKEYRFKFNETFTFAELP